MSPRGVAAGLLVLTFALAGCGSSASTVADDPGTTSTAPTTSAAPTTTSSAPTPAGSDTTAAASLITLEEPADRATVSGSFQASGMANSPEANVPWQILDASGMKVLEGAFTAEGWMDKLYPYRGKVDIASLAPGTYTFVVSVDDESDGESKLPPQKVSHTITVS